MTEPKKHQRIKSKFNSFRDVDWSDFIVVPLVSGIMAVALFIMHPFAGVLGILCAGFLCYYAYIREKESRQKTLVAIENLNQDFDEITKSAVFSMPFPIAILNGNGVFLWYNTSFKNLFNIETTVIGEGHDKIFEGISLNVFDKKSDVPFSFEIGDSIYLFYHNTVKKGDEKTVLLYGIDNTEDENVRRLWLDEKPVVFSIIIDNYDELRAKTSEEDRPIVFAKIDRLINQYAQEYEAYLTKYESDRYVVIMEHSMYLRAESQKFYLLEDIRTIKSGSKINPTISIGIGIGHITPQKLQREAHTAIDIALSRGGDQVVIKNGDEIKYFGGKTQATERISKVKARVMANAISQFIDEASEVFVMGHKNPDMDSYGSCLGIRELVKKCGKNAYVVLDQVTPAIENLYNKAKNDLPELIEAVISPEQAIEKLKDGSLILVLDNHRHDSTACPELLDHENRIIIIDHHRRGADYIENAVISYIEPYASSASELVTELLGYVDEQFKLPQVVAEGLLAGITVDTKNFFYQAGVRTFEAAAFLKRQGADSMVVKQLFKDDFKLIQYRSEIISSAESYSNNTIIGYFKQDIEGSTLIASQAADDLLGVRNVEASFVLTLSKGRVHISARSLGNVSVQLIMERIGGGGHLTASATQLDMNMDQADQLLKKAIDEYFIEEGENESNLT